MQRATQKEPKSLDFEEWILFGLLDNNPIFRLLSLEEIASSGCSPHQIPHIEFIRSEDPSSPCRQLAAKILSEEALQNVERPFIDISAETAETIDAIFAEKSETRILDLLRSIRKAPPQFLIVSLRDYLLQENPSEVVEAGFWVLFRFGNTSDASLAATFLGSSFPKVIHVALEILRKYDRELLLQVLPGLLASGDYRIRADAIRQLRGIDSAEALVHLKSLLFHKDARIRQFALRELLLISFDEAQNLYLQYISIETAPLLLFMSGLAISSNPNPAIPMKLFDIYLASRDIKQRILGFFVNQSVQGIRDSGILKESIENYLFILKEKLESRRTDYLLNLSLRELDNAEAEIRTRAIERLKNYSNLPQVVEAFSKRFEQEPDDEIKFQLGLLSGRLEAGDYSSLNEAVAADGFINLPNSRQTALLAGIKKQEDFRIGRNSMQVILSMPIKKTLIIDTLNKFSKWGDKNDSPSILPLLNHSDPGVLGGAIKALGKLDPDTLLPLLNTFLSAENTFVKLAALEFYLMEDKEDAIQHLQGMLKSPQRATRRHALSLIPLLDYACAEPMLIEFFEREKQAEVKIESGFMIASNPSREGIQSIFNQTHDDKIAMIPELEELWNLALEAGSSILGMPKDHLETECRENLLKKQAKATAPAPSYSYRKVAAGKELTAPPAIEEKKALSNLLDRFKEYQTLVFGSVIIVLVVSILGWWFSSGNNHSAKTPISMKSLAQKNPQANEIADGNQNLPLVVAGRRDFGGNFLSGATYISAMKSANSEIMTVSKDFNIKSERAFQETLVEMSKDPEYAGYAEFYLNENCKNGMDALESGKLSEAKEFLLKALSDSKVSNEAKLLACQTLMGVAFEIGDKKAIEKAMETMLSLVPPGDIPKGYDQAGIKTAFAGMDRMHEIPPDQIDQAMKKLSGQYPQFTPEMQKNFADGLKNMQRKFK